MTVFFFFFGGGGEGGENWDKLLIHVKNWYQFLLLVKNWYKFLINVKNWYHSSNTPVPEVPIVKHKYFLPHLENYCV